MAGNSVGAVSGYDLQMAKSAVLFIVYYIFAYYCSRMVLSIKFKPLAGSLSISYLHTSGSLERLLFLMVFRLRDSGKILAKRE